MGVILEFFCGILEAIFTPNFAGGKKREKRQKSEDDTK
ncbi:hypothetical protein J2S36_001237 [Arcanobacterium hippocoleae]|uniref:Uncharacterized protein n=1 Tax=Arcanobacterium hippocoleae TaxID=149017 RepID=A0ABU1T309_9ACTO|nr:hypothetical protein [Arcanobacterium hippocoleae]